MMKHSNLAALAAVLPEVWRSTSIAKIGNANLKVLRMDEAGYAEESHAHDEALLVLEGQLNLSIAGVATVLRQHDICMIPAGTVHGVLPGSAGSLMIIEAP